jgi:autotransporter-associated beta strand protein
VGDSSANVWNLNGVPNWSGGEKFMTGDSVLFDDTGSVSPAVAVTGTILPSALTVSADVNYTFGGSGSLVGGMLVTKSGAGNLTLVNTNTYYGGTLVNGGTLTIGAGGTSGSLGSGPLTNNATVIWNRNDDTIFGNVIHGSGGLLVRGSSVLTLTASNLFTGSVVVSNGVLRLGHSNALGTAVGSTYVTNNGTLDVNAQTIFPEPLVVSGAGYNGQGALINSGAAQLNTTTNVTLAGDTTFGGINRWDIRGVASSNPAIFSGNDFNLTKVGNNIVDIKDATGSEVGNVTVNAGALLFEGISALNNVARTLTVNTNATLAFINLSNTVMRDVILNSGKLQVATGSLSFAGAAMTLSGINTLSNAAGTWNITNAIGGSGIFIKQGPGTLNLVSSGAWSGTVTNEAGALVYYQTDALAGNIYNSGTVGFAPASGATWTFPHLITGTGVVMQAGDGLGTTILNNALNNASGGIVIGNGTLEVQAGTFLGNLLTTNGTLRIGPNVTVNANNVTVGQNIGNVFSTNLVAAGGVLNLGTGSGSELRVGYRTVDNISPVGVLDVSAMNTFTANVGNALISWCSSGTGGNLPLGDWLLATNNTIYATNILVGYSSGIGTPYVPNGRIVFGSGNSTVHTPWLRVGGSKGSGGLYLTNGGSLYLSNQVNRANFLIGINDAGNTATLPTNIVDFSGGLISAYLNDMILARRANGGSGCVSSYIYTSTNANNRLDVNNVTIASAEGVSSGGNKSSGLLGWGNGVMTINSNVVIGYFNPTNGGGLVEGELRINGGLVNVHGDIIGDTNASSISIVTLDGGTLDMYPAGDTHGVGQIGYPTNPIANLNLYSGVLRNLAAYNGKAGNTVTKSGSGTLLLEGANTYTGATVINGGILRIDAGVAVTNTAAVTVQGGTLMVNGVVGSDSSIISVNTGTLGGKGQVNGSPANFTGGTLAPGELVGLASTLTFANILTLNPASRTVIVLNKADVQTNDLIRAGIIQLGGTLEVTNLGATSSIQLGDTFKLFEGSVQANRNFSNFVLPTLTAGLAWDTSAITNNGTITVVQGGTPPIIVAGPQSQTNWVGSNVTFTVVATGTPLPGYQWFFGTNLLAGETSSNLVISSLTLNQAGQYSVQVTNVAGATNATASLTVWYLLPAPVVGLSSNAFNFQFVAETNRAYWLEARTNLIGGSWVVISGITNAVGATNLLDTAATETNKFYRIGSQSSN